MLLTQAEWSPLPIAHLLALAHLELEEMLCHLGKARLVGCNAHLAIVCLSINEIGEQFVELHRWEMASEHIQVAFEREADAEGIRVGEDLREDIVEERVGCQCYQINKVGCRLITQLEQSWPHDVKLGHRWAPLRVHTNDWLTDQLLQLLAIPLRADHLDLEVSRQSEAGPVRDGPKLILRHIVKLRLVLDPRHLALQHLARIVVLPQVVSLPDTCSLLEIA